LTSILLFILLFRNGDRAFASIRKAIRAVPSSKGIKRVESLLWGMSTSFLSLPQILQILHTVEECPDTLAFATEPVLASLANILAFYVSQLLGSPSAPF
jgi:hypothetical protein